MKPHGPFLAWLDRLSERFVFLFQDQIMQMIIAVELFLAAAFLFKPLWRVTVPVGFLFAGCLEIFMRPRSFAWDIIAVLLLFLPAARLRLSGFLFLVFILVRFSNVLGYRSPLVPAHDLVCLMAMALFLLWASVSVKRCG